MAANSNPPAWDSAATRAMSFYFNLYAGLKGEMVVMGRLRHKSYTV